MYLARYANRAAILAHFAGFSIAEITAEDLTRHGFKVVCSESDQINEPHADVFPPAGVGKKALTNLVKRHIVPASRLVHIDEASLALASRVPDAAREL